MVCSIDLRSELDKNPVARQMLASLLHYMGGAAFRPAVELTPEQVRNLAGPVAAMRRLGAKVLKASSFEDGYEPKNAIDGDVATMWHTRWTGCLTKHPHEIQFVPDQPACPPE